MYQIIDIPSWDRRELYEHFARLKMPHYVVAADIDVTRLLQYKREHRLSFYLSLIYLATKTLNGIENFRLRMKDDQVVLYDRIETNFTHKLPGEKYFRFHTAPFEGSLQEYVAATTEAMSRQTTLFGGLGDIPNVAYLSCITTLAATAISNPTIEDAQDAIPRINWGKYVERDGRWTLNVTLTANHRFIDGPHIGLFFNKLQEEIDRL